MGAAVFKAAIRNQIANHAIATARRFSRSVSSKYQNEYGRRIAPTAPSRPVPTKAMVVGSGVTPVVSEDSNVSPLSENHALRLGRR